MFEGATIVPGTKVIGSDWNDIGEVQNLILDQKTYQISKLVIQTHTLGLGYKLLDIREVNRLLDSGKLITLNLTRDMVEALPDVRYS